MCYHHITARDFSQTNAAWQSRKNSSTHLSLSSQLPSGIVGRPGTLKWLAWRFCAVLLDTIQTSFLWSGLLHSLERYSVIHLATRSFQWSSSLSLICEEDKQDRHTTERLHTEIALKYAATNKSGVDFPPLILNMFVVFTMKSEEK